MTDTDASLLAKKLEQAAVWYHGELGEPPESEPPIAALLQEAAAALRRSGEALRRLQEDHVDAIFNMNHYLAEFKQADEHAAKAHRFLEQEGYRRCDIPACNCGSWHQHRENARQSGAEGTEAGGRSQPLAPTIEEI